MAKVDRALLASYVDAWAEFAAMTRRKWQLGLEHPDYFRVVRACARASDRLVQLGQQFGLSPAARPRLRAADPPTEPDEFERLLNKNRFFRDRSSGVRARDRYVECKSGGTA